MTTSAPIVDCRTDAAAGGHSSASRGSAWDRVLLGQVAENLHNKGRILSTTSEKQMGRSCEELAQIIDKYLSQTQNDRMRDGGQR